MTDKNKLIDLILKLSNLTTDSGAFQGEIANASARIQEIMDKHSISWAEIHSKQSAQQEAEFQAAFSERSSEYVHRGILSWHWQLARQITRVTHTRHFASGNHMVFFGTEENSQIASQLYTLWIVNLTTMSEQATQLNKRRLKKKYRGIGRKEIAELYPEENPKYFRTSWLDGCILAISRSITEQEQSRNEGATKALALFDAELLKAYNKRAEGFRKVSSHGASGFSQAGRQAGLEAGSKINITSKPIGSGAKQLKG